jgi:hypothetical protein
MRSTAMSVVGSLPRTLALYSRRSLSLTVTSFASRTTCALVSTRPSALMMKPEPMPLKGICGLCRPRCWKPGMPRKNLKNGIVLAGRRAGRCCRRRARLVHAFDGDADDGGADCLTIAR